MTKSRTVAVRRTLALSAVLVFLAAASCGGRGAARRDGPVTLKTDDAQRAFAEYGMRPVDERVPASNELFAQEGAFTRVYASLHAAE